MEKSTRRGDGASVIGIHFDDTRRLNRSLPGAESMASYVLLAIVIGLVIYLFYAVINPEKF